MSPSSNLPCLPRLFSSHRGKGKDKGHRKPKGDQHEKIQNNYPKNQHHHLPTLPSDLIDEILRRLPPAEIVRLGCPRITSLAEMHLRQDTSHPPLVAFECYSVPGEESFKGFYKPYNGQFIPTLSIGFLHEMKEAVKTDVKNVEIDLRFASAERNTCTCFLYGSYNGFLLFKNAFGHSGLLIWNPITKEKVIVSCLYDGSVCGFFFHPVSGEYRVILQGRDHWLGKKFKFTILSLTKTKFKSTILSPCPVSMMNNPLDLNGALYWIADDVAFQAVHGILPACPDSIVVFHYMDDNVQQFRTIGHPPVPQEDLRGHCKMKLQELDGRLCCCVFLDSTVHLWILQDLENNAWVRSHIIDTIPRKNAAGSQIVEVIYIKGDELLLSVNHEQLFVYNIRAGGNFFRKVCNWNNSSSTMRLTRPVAHISTLASLYVNSTLISL